VAWTVHKFGGSSLADADCFGRVATIIEEQQAGNQAVVVSAMGGFTDALLQLVEGAQERLEPRAVLTTLTERYQAVVSELVGPADGAALMQQFADDQQNIDSVLKALGLVGSASHRSRDLVAGFGELWSARLLAAVLKERGNVGPQVRWLDARDVLVVEFGEMGPVVLWERSRHNLENTLADDFQGVAVVTGFIARDPAGLQTTLGRNGSDFSASIFGALLDATEVVIWTDVDGVMSGDPRRVPEAAVIDQLSYSEAMELAYFGAKVIHPQTMAPAIGKKIPIRIRNTFRPSAPGSVISTDSGVNQVVKGITAVNDVALFNLEGSGMIGVPGTADRLFGSLRQAGVSVILISQGSSEHSICFAVPGEDAPAARAAVEKAFHSELGGGQVQRIEENLGCSILAVVGDGMAGYPGVAGRFFRTLGAAGINVRAIAQGASERNISVVIDGDDTTRALRAVHSSFYLSAKTLSIGLIGPGAVGNVLLEQILGQQEQLRNEFNLDLRVRAIGTSQKMCLAERAVELGDWRGAFQRDGVALDLEKFADHVQADHLPHAVIVDCTADQSVADRYGGWLARGIHIVTPNKKAHSGSMDYYSTLTQISREQDSQFLYETTVGAGLPVISTLKDLVQTGDEVRSISGIFSGTLAYLFNVFDGSVAFSDIVREAHNLGYTEPDPRDDLSGLDVARKLVILAREVGMSLELADLKVESLVPPDLVAGDASDFLARLGEHDGAMSERLRAADSAGEVLRYVGHLDVGKGEAWVGLRSFEKTHPFATIDLTDNIIQFVTRRYCNNPLIIRGPGAGPDVTAAGVFADLIRLSSTLSSSAA
jgi:aspartokinase/homoserine dehydrogenase 1